MLDQIRNWLAEQAWLMDYSLYGNSAERWLMALVAFLFALLVLVFLRRMLSKKAAKLAGATSSGWDDTLVAAFEQTRLWFLIVIALFIASNVLNFASQDGESVRNVIQKVVILTLLLQSALWGNVLVGGAFLRYAEKKADQDPAAAMTISALAFVAKLALYSLLMLLALSNLGVDVTALVTGLGIGGIAVALAVQNILGDLLASMSIIFDKPFVPGDFIIVGSEMGTVQQIGLKTTRLKSISGEQLVFSNNDLLQSRIRNYRHMEERRIVFKFGVTYDTPRESLQEIPDLVKQVITSQEEVRFDRAHFAAFGDFSLDFEVVYYVLQPDYALYMDVQQEINLNLLKRFEALGIEFAFPTQTLHLHGNDAT